MDMKERFRQVYEMHGPALYRFCLLQMKNQADAEDVMQEVFLKRLYRAPHFASPEHEKRWLYRVALNQCKDEWKRRHRSDLPLEAAALMAVPPEQRELLEQVAALPEKMRTVIHLHYYEGYSIEEIAQVMGISVSAVKMRMKRGRDALRKEQEGVE